MIAPEDKPFLRKVIHIGCPTRNTWYINQGFQGTNCMACQPYPTTIFNEGIESFFIICCPEMRVCMGHCINIITNIQVAWKTIGTVQTVDGFIIAIIPQNSIGQARIVIKSTFYNPPVLFIQHSARHTGKHFVDRRIKSGLVAIHLESGIECGPLIDYCLGFKNIISINNKRSGFIINPVYCKINLVHLIDFILEGFIRPDGPINGYFISDNQSVNQSVSLKRIIISLRDLPHIDDTGSGCEGFECGNKYR